MVEYIYLHFINDEYDTKYDYECTKAVSCTSVERSSQLSEYWSKPKSQPSQDTAQCCLFNFILFTISVVNIFFIQLLV